MTIQNSNFINNTAKEGGAICNQYSTLTLLNNTIKNCNALSMGDNIYNEGILSNVYLIILNNQTIKVVKGQLVNITASLNDDNGNLITGGNIDLIVNNESITNLTVNEGIISYNYNVTKEGKYTVKGNYSQAQNTILKSSILDTTIKSISNLKGNDLTEYYGQGLNFTAKLSDYYGNPISYQRVALNLTRLSSGASKVYWVTTDVNGEYQLPINLAIGSYKIQSLYYGNDSYQGCNCTNSIKVSMMSKISTLISANDFIGDFGVSKNFTGVLKTISGVPISYQRVALNLTRLSSGASKVYWVTTDVNGEYQLPINLSVGIYTILSNYYGSNVFNYDSSIASLIVNS
jgi:predicted outer membrane repeat protein